MLLFLQRPVATLKAFCCFQASCACALSLSLSAQISHSAHSFLTSSVLSCLSPFSPSRSLFAFFLLPCSLICLFPLSSVCTMHINYSEAVSQFLQLIQSEQGSALMGSCCTCYRLQHTLETAERRRRRGLDRQEGAVEEGGWEEEIKTARRRRQTGLAIETARYLQRFSPQL